MPFMSAISCAVAIIVWSIEVIEPFVYPVASAISQVSKNPTLIEICLNQVYVVLLISLRTTIYGFVRRDGTETDSTYGLIPLTATHTTHQSQRAEGAVDQRLFRAQKTTFAKFAFIVLL
ncbi:uncharacterized protein LOC111259028 isoform X2 [Varroa jacobsoni]|uniref:uncharacterized protein LOC111259028 isoform X2 n=1 Tax=Varroa jacobsoni TaxID=62625 RepID=UPI000BFA7F67|nr:uncharacterized protein LOC111259028 isoform X2 [Varroa jacobsoni]